MDIHVMGVGEAADPDYPTASITATADGWRLLVDCGHSVPPVLWRKMPAADAVDAIALTGIAPDRSFGLVPVLLRWAADGRRKPLDLLVAPDCAHRLGHLLEAAGLVAERDLPFPLRWHDLTAGRRVGPFGLAAVAATHDGAGHAIALEWGGVRCVYGTGVAPTPEAEALSVGADLLFHACDGHDSDGGDADGGLEALAGRAEQRRIAAVRLHRVRRDRRDAVAAAAAGFARLSMAVPGQLIRLR